MEDLTERNHSGIGRGTVRFPEEAGRLRGPAGPPARRAANTDYAGDTELMWIKGSGGDLGTLTEGCLAVLRLDRLQALTEVYPGAEREDEMVAAFDFRLHGKGGAAPSIDTATHGLVDAPHVDHLHPDSGIALARAADGEKLTAECFGDTVAWVPWRRSGFQLGLDITAIKQADPQAVGCVLGGHGITAWGDTSQECEANALHIIRTAEAFLAERGRPEPFGPVLDGHLPLPGADLRAGAAALAPLIRALASADRPQVGHYTDTPEFRGTGRGPPGRSAAGRQPGCSASSASIRASRKSRSTAFEVCSSASRYADPAVARRPRRCRNSPRATDA